MQDTVCSKRMSSTRGSIFMLDIVILQRKDTDGIRNVFYVKNIKCAHLQFLFSYATW